MKEERGALLCTLTLGRLRAVWAFRYDYDDDDDDYDDDYNDEYDDNAFDDDGLRESSIRLQADD